MIKADSQRGYKALDNAFLFDDADICVTVTALDIGKPEASAAGLAFWAQDYRNAYFLLLATNGYYKIGRMMDGAWVNAPLDWTQSDAIVQGVNKPNTLRLTIKGQSLTVFINGKPGAMLAGAVSGDVKPHRPLCRVRRQGRHLEVQRPQSDQCEVSGAWVHVPERPGQFSDQDCAEKARLSVAVGPFSIS